MNVTERKTLYDGHYKLTQLLVQDGDQQLKRERFEPGQAVGALVFDTHKQRYLFVRQFRVGSESEVLEIPAGVLDEGDKSPEEAIRREIEEELGYAVDSLEPIVNCFPSPGNSAEKFYLFYAEVSRQTGPGGGLAAENEKLETVELSLPQLAAEPWADAKTLVAVQWERLRKQ
jgi:nudix-type nucleoside diphosphatase (YffH/AdpP family)